VVCRTYKGGNTLFRNPDAVGLNAVPLAGWIKWFGSGKVPKFSNVAPVEETVIASDGVEYLEPKSLLQIVPEADVACVVPGGIIEEEKDWTLQNADPVEPSFKAAQKAKAEGVELYSKNMFDQSIDRFTRAISACQTLELTDEVSRLQGLLHSNRSLAFLKTEPPTYSMVVFDCNEALRIDPTNFKALYRRASALSSLGDYGNAMLDIIKVREYYVRIEAHNPQAMKLFEEIKENLRQETQKWNTPEKKMWNRAIPKDSESGCDGEYYADTAEHSF